MYAGFWRRFGAFWIDAVIVVAIINIIYWILVVVKGWPVPTSTLSFVGHRVQIPGVSLFPATLLGLIIAWPYFASLESSARQATVGKMALSIRVTDEAGGRITFWRATARYWAKLISAAFSMIGFIMIAFTRRKQGLHDMLTNCVVVKRSVHQEQAYLSSFGARH